jgi:hypothetical protein
VLSEGDRYQQLEPASRDLLPRSAPDALDDGLDGWGFMMRTADGALALLYFEQKAVAPRVGRLTAGADGVLAAPAFPGGARRAGKDWAAKLKGAARPR